MPYYHTKDNGKIWFWTRKCSVCGQIWPIRYLFAPKVPKGMIWEKDKVVVPKGPTSYASWGDKFPGVGLIASRLPSWPRWARVLTVSIFFLVILVLVIYYTRGF